MKRHLIVLGFLFCEFAFAQTINFAFLKEIPLNADAFFGVDSFDNNYYSLNNVFYKTTPTKTYQYQNLALGAISSVSIYNPLELVVFYKDFNTVIILDNTLNEIEKLHFLNETISLVAKAGKNQLWLYNTDNQQLELYDYQTKSILAKTQSQSVLLPLDLKGTANLAWIKTNDHLLVYNNYGTMVKSFPFKFDNFTLLNDDEILFNRDSDFFLVDNKQGPIPLKTSFKAEATSFVNDKLYLFFNKRIFIYHLLKN